MNSFPSPKYHRLHSLVNEHSTHIPANHLHLFQSFSPQVLCIVQLEYTQVQKPQASITSPEAPSLLCGIKFHANLRHPTRNHICPVQIFVGVGHILHQTSSLYSPLDLVVSFFVILRLIIFFFARRRKAKRRSSTLISCLNLHCSQSYSPLDLVFVFCNLGIDQLLFCCQEKDGKSEFKREIIYTTCRSA